MFSIIDQKLELSCKWMEYSLLDPDINYGYLFHDITPWNNHCKTDVSTWPKKMIKRGEFGDISATFIKVSDIKPPFDKESFDSGKIEIWCSNKKLPTEIKVDLKIKENNKCDIVSYKSIIKDLNSINMHVNNSFLHMYSLKKELYSLDGGVVGLLDTIQIKDNIKHYIKHSKQCRQNCIMDVFCANSIVYRCLDKRKIEQITEIVGKKNISYIDDSLVFSLPEKNNFKYGYRLHNRTTIYKLRRVLCL